MWVTYFLSNKANNIHLLQSSDSKYNYLPWIFCPSITNETQGYTLATISFDFCILLYICSIRQFIVRQLQFSYTGTNILQCAYFSTQILSEHLVILSMSVPSLYCLKNTKLFSNCTTIVQRQQFLGFTNCYFFIFRVLCYLCFSTWKRQKELHKSK